MDNLQNSQLEILNRLAHMLDENSVQYVADQDPQFQQFVSSVYRSIDKEADKLLTDN